MSTISFRRSWRRSTIHARSGSSSTSRWTAPSITASWRLTSRVRAVWIRSRFRASSIPTGWTTARQNICSTGSRNTISKSLSTRHGNTNAGQTIPASSTIRVDVRMAGTSVSVCFKGRTEMRKLLLLAATAAMALGASHALSQEKKQLVIVVKGLDNPFFEAINQGCQKWNSENASSEYECFYTGPASTSDEAGEAQIVQDMLGKADTVAMAISPSNAKLIAQTIKTANPSIPIMTLDADLAAEDSALRKNYLGTDNYLMGQRIGDYIKKAKPDGGKICTIEGNPGADNIWRRAKGMRDALTGRRALRNSRAKAAGRKLRVARCSPTMMGPRAFR